MRVTFVAESQAYVPFFSCQSSFSPALHFPLVFVAYVFLLLASWSPPEKWYFPQSPPPASRGHAPFPPPAPATGSWMWRD